MESVGLEAGRLSLAQASSGTIIHLMPSAAQPQENEMVHPPDPTPTPQDIFALGASPLIVTKYYRALQIERITAFGFKLA